jgi:competence protein ComEC
MGNMKIIIFDVGNAFCALVCSPEEYGMMIDCGSSTEKANPVDIILNPIIKNWLDMKDYKTKSGESYPLALLHITHPDDDHVRNSAVVCRRLKPYNLQRVYSENFDDADTINNDYIECFDKVYRTASNESINWGFDENKTFCIPIDEVKDTDSLKQKVRNNSSIVRFIKFAGKSILFTGDLEKEGWERLVQNKDFKETVKDGIDILIAPHHGHKSGFPTALFNLIKKVKVVIMPKDSEANKDGTDVSSQYSNYAEGISYLNLNDKKRYMGNVLTTRSNGNIFISIENENPFPMMHICCEKASSNHKLIQ